MRWLMSPPPNVGQERYPYVFELDMSSLLLLQGNVAQRRQMIKDRRQHAHQTAEWCRLQYGTDDRLAARGLNLWCWTAEGTSFKFRFERDAFEFKMRWG